MMSELFSSELTYYASSLSFYTIFTIIPLLMIILTLMTNMPWFDEYYTNFMTFIVENMIPSNSQIITNYINSFLSNSVEIGIIGFISIVLTSMLFFQNYEYIVSKIFHTKERTLWQAITTYWTLLTLTPIGLIGFFYLSAKIQLFLNSYESLSGWINFMAIFPFLILWTLFFLIFKISANTKVHTLSATITSFVTSLVFVLAKEGFIYYVFYNNTYETIYGSFSALLFFFLWIYVSWIIFTYGLKICYLINRYECHKEIQQESCENQNI